MYKPWGERAEAHGERAREIRERVNNGGVSANARREARNGATLPMHRCCVCRHGLEEGYAVLFENPDGTEGKLCADCWKAVAALAQSTDRGEVRGALRYFERFRTVGPTASEHLNPFIQCGKDFLEE